MTSAITSAGCSYWSTQLAFTSPISARHFCLLGNNRYAAPVTFGDCNDHDPTNGSICRQCLSWDGTQRRDCTFLKGYGPEIGMVPPSSGYDDRNCPVGYEKYTDVTLLELSCPSDTVSVLEIFPTMVGGVANTSSVYDFTITSPHDVSEVFESHQCLTGTGGRDCGKDGLTMLAYEEDGHCRLVFQSGVGYKVQCDNGFQEASSFLGGTQEQSCFAKNALTCLDVMQLTAAFNNDVVVVNGEDENDNQSGLCGLDESEGLANAVAWLVGASMVLLTLLPGLAYWRKRSIRPVFVAGVVAEAMKNGLVMASIVSVNWNCLQQYGMILPTGNHAIFLPYGLIAFSMADTILAIIALVSQWGQDLEDSFDEFKWLDQDNNLYRRIMTFATIVIFGGLGGFMQLALVLEGTVDSPDGSGDNALSTWASWVFIISASIGGFFGTILVLAGVYTGRMRVAWKTYKVLVGDIPGLVSAIDLAVVLSAGWIGEIFTDFLHIGLYLPPLLAAKKS